MEDAASKNLAMMLLRRVEGDVSGGLPRIVGGALLSRRVRVQCCTAAARVTTTSGGQRNCAGSKSMHPKMMRRAKV